MVREDLLDIHVNHPEVTFWNAIFYSLCLLIVYRIYIVRLARHVNPCGWDYSPGPENNAITIKTISRESRMPAGMQGEVYRAEVWLDLQKTADETY